MRPRWLLQLEMGAPSTADAISRDNHVLPQNRSSIGTAADSNKSMVNFNFSAQDPPPQSTRHGTS